MDERRPDAAELARAIAAPESAWLGVLRRYLLFVAPANLAWESAHLPLYTIWRAGSPGEIAFAVLHCTGGDVLIAVACLFGALTIAGSPSWPGDGRAFRRVGLVAIGAGVAYTIFSEWLNIVVRKSWAYSDLMPVIPGLDAGLSPVLQWIAIPLAGLWWARRGLPRNPGTRRLGASSSGGGRG